jgi:hypothetical protein
MHSEPPQCLLRQHLIQPESAPHQSARIAPDPYLLIPDTPFPRAFYTESWYVVPVRYRSSRRYGA